MEKRLRPQQLPPCPRINTPFLIPHCLPTGWHGDPGMNPIPGILPPGTWYAAVEYIHLITICLNLPPPLPPAPHTQARPLQRRGGSGDGARGFSNYFKHSNHRYRYKYTGADTDTQVGAQVHNLELCNRNQCQKGFHCSLFQEFHSFIDF